MAITELYHQRGKRIMLSDGRSVPSFGGFRHTEESKRKISEQLRGRAKPEEVVRQQSKTWKVVRPLVLRGAMPIEITPLTDFTYSQVKSSYYTKRPDWHAVKIPTTKEEKTQRKQRSAGKDRPRRMIDRVISYAQRRRTAFAKALHKEGFITDDLIYWELMHKMYRMTQRRQPPDLDFAGKLALEAFVMADRKAKREADPSLLERYKELAMAIDERLFEENTDLAQAMRFTDAALDKFERARKMMVDVWTNPQSASSRYELIARANRDRIKIQDKVFLLAIRRGFIADIAPITAFKQEQVSNAVNHMRNPKNPEDPYKLPRPTRQEVGQAHRIALVGRKRGESRVYTEEQLQIFAQARGLLQAGVFTRDLSHWERLPVFCEEQGIAMPESFAERLLLEAQYVAMFPDARGVKYEIPDQLALTYKEKGIEFPQNPTDALFLIDLYNARVVKNQTGDGSSLLACQRFYDKHDPDVYERRAKDMRLILELTSGTPTPAVGINANSGVVHGEVKPGEASGFN